MFETLRRDHLYYKIAVVKVTCEYDTMLKRAATRGQATGRVVPTPLLLQSLEQVDESVEQLAPFAGKISFCLFVRSVLRWDSKPVHMQVECRSWLVQP